MKIVSEKDDSERFDYFWRRFREQRLEQPRPGSELPQSEVARAAFEAGWEAAGGQPHADPSVCKHPNVYGIAVVVRPCTSCGKLVY